ncbi:hypothetical protein BDV96DRAFT_381915 [Lophiotrema nucula]|uniref:Fe2OG dioxygenase domain-containing protein n=1 Tax=Lophiotrema nucula TaxID=690887 RepID=A0A6A5ZHL4_9PLEO|nr:hypothetical protein BDV96DRAFT_381915 [Lophiotrema nucula]
MSSMHCRQAASLHRQYVHQESATTDPGNSCKFSPANEYAIANLHSQKSMMPKALLLALPLAIPVALFSTQILPSLFQTYLSQQPLVAEPTIATPEKEEWSLEACEAHKYTSEIVSLDPLVIYINNFTSFQEAEDLIKAGEEDFESSFISAATGLKYVTGRTSQSAPLDTDLPLVDCILHRARTFVGSMLQPYEPFSIPQLVRYFPSQKYDLHTDFWPQHQVMNDGSGRLFNRVASFFVFLRDNCTNGETYFPSVSVLDDDADAGGRLSSLDSWAGKISRGVRKDGKAQGVKFKPITGNAIFWVNMKGEGKDAVGDRRVVHAGLPVGEGEKIGMNLWPRKFYGREDD